MTATPRRLRRRRDALDALARAVARADDRRVGDELGAIDGWRVRRALRWAELHVVGTGRDPVGERVHRLQVAWLRAAGEVQLGDAVLTEAAQAEARFHAASERLGPRPPPRTWSARTRWIIAAGAALAVAVTIVAVSIANAPRAPEGDGATLAPDAEAAFVEALTQWVIGLDRMTRARFDGALDREVASAADTLAARRLRLITPEVAAFFGEAATDALGAMLDQALRVADGRHWESEEDTFAARVRAANRAIAEAKRSYFFDGYAALYNDGRPETSLFFFRVVARRAWTVATSGDGDADTVDALHLRRLDRLNIVQHLLGYTSRRMDVAALLLDQLETEVLSRIGPSLAAGGQMPLGRSAGDADWALQVRKAAGERIRAACADEFPDDGPGLAAFGALLAERVALVDTWNTRLDPRGIALPDYATLALDDRQLVEVERYLGPEARRTLAALQEQLATPEHAARFARVLARHARPVEQHEVQHRLDYALGDAFQAPRALLDLLGVEPTSALARHEDVMRTALELSAYTSEIARDARWAAIDLTLLAENVLEGGGGAEGHSAVLVLDGLRAELGLPGLRLMDTPPVTAARAAEALLALLQVPSENLARAASALWTRWFGRELPVLQPEVDTP